MKLTKREAKQWRKWFIMKLGVPPTRSGPPVNDANDFIIAWAILIVASLTPAQRKQAGL